CPCTATSRSRPVVICGPAERSQPLPCATALMRERSPSPSTGTLRNADSSALKPAVLALARLCATSACARMVCAAPVIATYSERSMVQPPRSAVHVDHRLGDLVVGGDHLRVR